MKEVYLSISNNIKLFIKQQRAAITIEFVFTIILLTVILTFMIDLTMLRSNLGKLDNSSYSLANILRERKQLYNGNEMISLDSIEKFRKLAKYAVYGDDTASKELFIVIESVSFTTDPLDQQKEPKPDYKRFGDVSHCTPYKNLDSLSNIAPRSEAKGGRKIPIYQVTICIPSYSVFKSVILNESSNSRHILRSSSMVVAR